MSLPPSASVLGVRDVLPDAAIPVAVAPDPARIDMTSATSIAARIERLPASRWHLNVRIIIGMATFFDAFDAVAIAFVIPVLAPLWHLHYGAVAFLISAGFAGQLVGALAFGHLAERRGRITVLNWTVLTYAIFGLACAFAPGFFWLLLLRFVQGLGLGGELPVAATFVSEISPAVRRGRSVMFYQLVAPIGFLAASLGSLVIVPHLGWQWMFVVGAIPALLTLRLRRLIPESPRWLARQGRLQDADAVLQQIEHRIVAQTGRPLPALATVPVFANAGPAHQDTHWSDLFRGIYLGRTLSVWSIWFCQAVISYGLLVWLPTIFRNIYKLSVTDALLYSSLGNVLSLVAAFVSAAIIDRYGRRNVFIIAFVGAAIPLLVLWKLGSGASAVSVMLLTALATALIASSQIAIWAYTPEIYPTRMRSLGSGVASSWARIGSIVSPMLVAWILNGVNGISGIFLFFACASIVGAVTVMFFLVETRNRVLEELSP